MYFKQCLLNDSHLLIAVPLPALLSPPSPVSVLRIPRSLFFSTVYRVQSYLTFSWRWLWTGGSVQIFLIVLIKNLITKKNFSKPFLNYKAVIKGVFRSLDCCYGNRLCLGNVKNVIKSGYNDLSKSNCWKLFWATLNIRTKNPHPKSFLPRQLNQGDDVKRRTNFCYHGKATSHNVSGVKLILPTET